MGVQTSLDAVAEAATIVDAMRAADDLAFEAGRDAGARTLRLLSFAISGEDELTAIAAVHALAGLPDAEAGRILERLLSDDRGFLRQHAAWALGSGLPRTAAIGRLLGMVVDGGFGGMLAERTLEHWSGALGGTLAVAVEAALLGVTEPDARARLVETLGLVRDAAASAPLAVLAADPGEPDPARVAAISAMGQRGARGGDEALLGRLAAGDGSIAEVARLALIDLDAAARHAEPARSDGLAIAQLFLHADIDPALSAAGAGDNGGIATLLVRLGDALVSDPTTGVDRVLTLSRGSVRDATTDLMLLGSERGGHEYGRIPLLHDPVPSPAAWPMRVAARRGIRRMLRAAGGVDALHLRMADVGSLAAFDVARELGVPVVFTVAPDPHAVIESLDRSGRLTRERFGRIDLDEHYWFRTRLVQRLAANAAHTVLFPRPTLAEDLRRLVGIDLAAHPERHSIVPEGVDLGTIDRALADVAAHGRGAPPSPAIAELRDLIDALPTERRSLPIIVSVGRLHRVKGMAALVEAWSRGPLATRANLLLIGGDLASPSPDEREQLDRIESLVPADAWDRSGLLLPGHRPNDVAASWLAAVRLGLPGLNAGGGVYACASLKEEFGIALLEAMATGLFVVAPDGGGPATYVDDGVTGILAATWDPDRLEAALEAAVAATAAEADPGRADRARAMVQAHFTIERMASALGGVYRGVAREEAALVEFARRAG